MNYGKSSSVFCGVIMLFDFCMHVAKGTVLRAHVRM